VNEVSCTATAAALEALERMGVGTRELTDGLPVSVERLRNPRMSIAWDTFAELMDRTGARLGVEGMHELGAAVLKSPSYRYVRFAASLLATPRSVLRLTNRFLGPSMFPLLGHRLEDLADGRMRLTLEVPSGYRVSEAFFWAVAGQVRAIPRLFDLPNASMELQMGDRQASFTVRLPHVRWQDQAQRVLRMAAQPAVTLRMLAAQRRAEQDSYEALARFRHDLHRLIERLPDGVVILRGGRVRYANSALVRALGYVNVDEVLGRPVTDFLPADERETFPEWLESPEAEAEHGAAAELRMLRRDGRTVVFDMRPVQGIAFAGERATLLVVRDLTDRKRLQQQLMLSDRMASLGTLAAGVAHEVNNPLAYAHISMQTLRRTLMEIEPGSSIDQPLLERMQEALSAAEHGIERVRTIVGDLRTFSRPDDEAIQPVDVQRVLESAISMANKELRHRALLQRDYGDLPHVLGNDSRLGQVFLNLLINAAQAFTTDDRQTNLIRLRTLSGPPGHVTVEVHDNGPGIPSDILEHVFVPFVTTKPAGVGTGLGLSICHRIVTRLGGRIGVESTPGQGTVVRVVLPAAEAPRPSAARSPSRMDGGGRRGRLLIVDDEPALLSALRSLLSASHDVVTAEGGAKAVDLLQRDGDFDLVLCDLMMSDLNGVQVYESIRAQRPDLAARVAFMTGGAYTGSTRKFLAGLTNPCLDKPFNVEEVLALVRQHMASAAG
jgi:two-component system, cell cycle sensor histidine kinase and response regulator CckA